MFGRCALWLREYIYFTRKRRFLSRRIVARSGALAAGLGQVHAPCEAEARRANKRRSITDPHRDCVLAYQGVRRARLTRRRKVAFFVENGPHLRRISAQSANFEYYAGRSGRQLCRNRKLVRNGIRGSRT